MINLVALARGAATYLPGVAALQRQVTRTGGTNSARYCYSVWLRHLTLGQRNGLCARVPRRVAELGPGDSLGIGLAALLSGAERYCGLDALPLANPQRNQAVFEELVGLFSARAPIPDDAEFPNVGPRLGCYDFPSALVPPLESERVAIIRRDLQRLGSRPSTIRYIAPWLSPTEIEEGGADMIFSQAVLEHVADLRAAYAAMRAWLAPGGWLSHQIDFRSHGTASEWYGHWTYEPWVWRLLLGRRAFLINREPHSTHLRLLHEVGLTVVCEQPETAPCADRRKLARPFAHLSDEDLRTCGTFIQARL